MFPHFYLNLVCWGLRRALNTIHYFTGSDLALSVTLLLQNLDRIVNICGY